MFTSWRPGFFLLLLGGGVDQIRAKRPVNIGRKFAMWPESRLMLLPVRGQLYANNNHNNFMATTLYLCLLACFGVILPPSGLKTINAALKMDKEYNY